VGLKAAAWTQVRDPVIETLALPLGPDGIMSS